MMRAAGEAWRRRRGEPPRRGQAGQIFLPSLLVLPALFLFIFLILETGKLSAQKIRHQFAMDAAAFVEMGQYTDILNRTEFVDGAFPWHLGDESGLASSGLFPQSSQGSLDNQPMWSFQFPSVSDADLTPFNYPNPPTHIAVVHLHPDNHAFTVPASVGLAIGNSYYAAYQLLGELARDQWTVFDTLSQQNNRHILARTSLWLNTNFDGTVLGCGDPANASSCGGEAARDFGKLAIRYHYVDSFYACKKVYTVNGVSYVAMVDFPWNFGGNDLYQLTTFCPGGTGGGATNSDLGGSECLASDPTTSDVTDLAKGWVIAQHWTPPANWWGIDMSGVSVAGGPPCQGTGGASNWPCVQSTAVSAGGYAWPYPTPKFHTELLP